MDFNEITWDDETEVGASKEADTLLQEIEKDDIETKEPDTKKEGSETRGKDKEEEEEEKETSLDWDNEDAVVSKEKSKTTEGQESPSVESLNEKDFAINYLKNKGFLDFELEEGVKMEDLSDEDKEEIIAEGFENAVSSQIEQVTKGLPDLLKNTIKYASKGGDAMEFLYHSLQKEETKIDAKMDMSEVENQKYILALDLESQGYDEDYITDFIETLEVKNKLQSVSEKVFKTWIQNQEEAEKQEAVQIENISKQRRQEELQAEKALSSIYEKTDIVKGVKLTPKEKKDLPEYLTKSAVDIGGGKKVTAFYRDLFMSFNDKEKLSLLGLIVKRDFNLESVLKDIETEAAKNLKDNIQRQSQSKAIVKPKNIKGRMLADLI